MRTRDPAVSRELRTQMRRTYDEVLCSRSTSRKLALDLENLEPSNAEVQRLLARLAEYMQNAKAAADSLLAASRELRIPLRTSGFGRNSFAWDYHRKEFQREINYSGANRFASGPFFTGRADAPTEYSYDLFISHASEDKNDFVRPLAETLHSYGLRVWYDELTLSIGDSLAKSIDSGLSSSRYGLVVLSPAFFAKNWPRYELNGLVAREMQGSKVVILPIWHRTTRDEVIRYSPSLGDKVALSSATVPMAEMAARIADSIRDA